MNAFLRSFLKKKKTAIISEVGRMHVWGFIEQTKSKPGIQNTRMRSNLTVISKNNIF